MKTKYFRSLLNSTTEENLLQKLEEGIAAANKREFQMAQLLKDHKQEEFLQVCVRDPLNLALIAEHNYSNLSIFST